MSTTNRSAKSRKPLPQASSKPTASRMNEILNLILIFFACAFIGWIWEVVLAFFQHGEFINRGVLHGPWLPIYGFGGLGITLLLRNLKDRPFLVVAIAVLFCGALEYFTGWYLETFKHLKWWDYSDQWLNLDGRICLMSLTIFGICGLLVVYFLYPLLTKYLSRLHLPAKTILCVVLISCFLTDAIYSGHTPNTGKGITSEVTLVDSNS